MSRSSICRRNIRCLSQRCLRMKEFANAACRASTQVFLGIRNGLQTLTGSAAMSRVCQIETLPRLFFSALLIRGCRLSLETNSVLTNATSADCTWIVGTDYHSELVTALETAFASILDASLVTRFLSIYP